MTDEITLGQEWATWVAGRRQWLLSTVTAIEAGRATLQYSSTYEMAEPERQLSVDTATMLDAPNLFRFIRNSE